MTAIQSHLRHGDFESAYRLAHSSGADPALVEVLSLLCDAPTEDQIDSQINERSEEEYSRGHEDGKDEGYDEARADASTLADRHCRALVAAENVLNRTRNYLADTAYDPAGLAKLDEALLALSMVVDELDDFDEAFHEASRANR